MVPAVTALLLAVGETALPAVLGRAVDAIAAGSPGSWPAMLALLVALLAVCDSVDDVAVGVVTARSTRWLRRSVVRHVLAAGPRASRRFSPGDLASRVVANAAGAGTVSSDVIRAVANLLPAVGGTVALAFIDPWLCGAFLVGMPFFLLAIRIFSRDASEAAGRYLETQGRIAGGLVDALAGARTIAAAGTVGREVQRVLEPLPDLRKYGTGMWQAQLTVVARSTLMVPLMEIVVLGVAGLRLAQGHISAGQLLAASQYVALATTIGSAVGSVNRLVRVRAGAQRIAEVLAEPVVQYGDEELPAGPGRIEFRNVTVRSDQRAVLRDVSLVIPAGALVALVGGSGAGKTTLALAVGRLVDLHEGEILLDGVPVADLSRKSLREALSYGFERPALLGRTIGDAISFGIVRPDAEQIVVASRAAQADHFIRRLPAAYETALVAAPMSGGEAQRIGLARAFAHGGRVLLLDDVAASLDTVTEHHVRQVLTGAFAHLTRLVVAHRASTAARADLVVWLEQGEVKAVGQHGELWADPAYRSVFDPRGAGVSPEAPTEVAGGVR